MTHHAANRVFLLLGILLVPGAIGEDPASASTQRLADVIVRPVSEVGPLERVTIALTRALIPGSKVFSPLYAYGRELACGEGGDAKQTILEHSGPAALVHDDKGVTRARYYKTAELDIGDVKRSGLCGDGSDMTWSIATTSPLDSDDIEEEQRYISRDVEQVERQLQARRD